MEASTSETGQVTGTKDKDYNIIWFTEQCLSNVLRLEQYAADAEREGDSELADFFRRAQGESRKGAEQGKDHLGLAMAAQDTTRKVEGLTADESLARTLERMRDEAEQTEERCTALADNLDGKKTAVLDKARETKGEATEMMKTYLGDDADGLDGRGGRGGPLVGAAQAQRARVPCRPWRADRMGSADSRAPLQGGARRLARASRPGRPERAGLIGSERVGRSDSA